MFNSHWSVREELATGKLVRVLPEWRLDDASVLLLIYARSNVLTPKVRVFMDFLIVRLGGGVGCSGGAAPRASRRSPEVFLARGKG